MARHLGVLWNCLLYDRAAFVPKHYGVLAFPPVTNTNFFFFNNGVRGLKPKIAIVIGVLFLLILSALMSVQHPRMSHACIQIRNNIMYAYSMLCKPVSSIVMKIRYAIAFARLSRYHPENAQSKISQHELICNFGFLLTKRGKNVDAKLRSMDHTSLSISISRSSSLIMSPIVFSIFQFYQKQKCMCVWLCVWECVVKYFR